MFGTASSAVEAVPIVLVAVRFIYMYILAVAVSTGGPLQPHHCDAECLRLSLGTSVQICTGSAI